MGDAEKTRCGGALRTVIAVLSLVAVCARAQNWPQWRGPEGDGRVAAGDYPVQFTVPKDLLWQASLPGRGGSTPVVWGDRIVLTSGVGEGTNGLDGVLCFDWSGKPLWQVTLGPQRPGKHRRGSGSCPSPVTDGKRVYVYFKSGALAALDFDGKVVWQTNLQTRYGPDTLWWDLGTSPVLADGKLIVAVLHETNSYLVALNPENGEEVWKVDRNFACPEESGQSYATPQVVRQDGRDTLVVWGGDHLSGHDLTSGAMLWECGGFNPQGKKYWRDIASAACAQGVAVVPYGREQQLAGIRIGGSGDVTAQARLWEKQAVGSDGPIPLIADGKVYLVNFKGRVWCLDLKTGQELWTTTLPSAKGVFYSSPVLVGDMLYFCREEGAFYVARIKADGLEIVNQTAFSDTFVATPVLVRGRLIMRGEKNLFCVGK